MLTSSVDNETRQLLALKLVYGLGPRLTKALLERFGSASGVLGASVDELRRIPHLRDDVARALTAAMQNAGVEKELELLDKHQARLLRLGTPEYPESLATLNDSPQLLYMRGAIEPVDKKAVAVVGSRHCTNYGRRIAERLAGDLARAGFTVVSGLARGIDGAAHRGALAAGGRTIAVLAGGLANVYPPEHADLAEEVAACGALLSEAAMSLPPMAEMFPARNRLISGLSRGVIIVEAAENSGALITARHAATQGREVFAVPGPIDSPASSGTLRLIKQGAILVRDVNDVLAELEEAGSTRALPHQSSEPPPPPKVPLTPNQQKLFEALTEEPVHVDTMVERTGLPVFEVSQSLMIMEMHGLVRRLPGNRFERR